MKKFNFTQSYLKSIFNYDPETGIFTWKIKRRKIQMGAIAGFKHIAGYWEISFDYERFLAHRLAWFYMTGKEPENEIDHIDGDRLNNRWCNLREANEFENSQNCKKPKTNTSGHKNVAWHKEHGCWHVQIRTNGKRVHVGYYGDINKAIKEAEKARAQHHKAFARRA